MKSRTAADRNRPASDATRVHLTKDFRYGPGKVKLADIQKAVDAVIKERVAKPAK
jgi:hypothetical protein